MNSALPYALSLLMFLLLVVREKQNKTLITQLLDRLMIKEGLEPLTEKREEPKMVEKRVMSKEALLAKAGAVRMKNPFADLVPKGTK